MRRIFPIKRLPPLWISFILIIIIIAFFSFEFFIFKVQKEGDRPLPMHFGNFGNTLSIFKNTPLKSSFSFAVMGDTRGGNGVAEQITRELKQTPLDFAVMFGDSTEGTNAHHRFFRAELEESFDLPFPILYVVGNHDVHPRRFPISKFEKLYGPTNFSFEYQRCLFIVLRAINYRGDPSDQESLEFLKTFSQKELNYERIFVFMHIPPPVPAFNSRKYTSLEEFINLFEHLNVDWVFAAHFHGYEQTQYKNTIYTVTGGGGVGTDESLYKQFNHAVVIRVGKDHISQRLIPVNTLINYVDWEDKIEKYAFTTGIEMFRRYPVYAAAVNLALITIMGIICYMIILQLKSRHRR